MTITNNVVAKELLSNRTAKESQNLAKDIFSMVPYQLKVAAALYQGANCALRERLTGRFTNASSVIQLVREDKDLASLYEETRQQDLYYIDYFVTCDGPNQVFNFINNYECPTEAMSELRLKFVNKNMVNPSSPAITHQYVLRRWDDVPLEHVKKSILMIVDPSFRNRHRQRGKRLPYIGGSTKLRVAKGLLEIIDPDPLDKSIISLGHIANWLTSEGSNLRQLIEIDINEKTETRVAKDIIKYGDKVVGGSADHRSQILRLGNSAHINYDPTTVTHFHTITDTAFEYGKSTIDRQIFFQLLRVSGMRQTLHKASLGEDVVGKWGIILTCESCTAIVAEDELEIRPPQYAGVRLPFIAKLDIKRSGLLPSSGNVAAYHSAHAYIARDMALEMMAWDHNVEDRSDLNVGEGLPRLNVNLTELSRCSFELVMC